MATDTRIDTAAQARRRQVEAEVRKADPKSVPALWNLVRMIAELTGVTATEAEAR